MTESIYPVPKVWADNSWLNNDSYLAACQVANDNPEDFWAIHAKALDWYKFPTEIKDVSYDLDDLHIRWFADGELNVCVNCVDRHLATRAEQTAIIWEGDDPCMDADITYQELYERVCQFANALRSLNVQKGDVVTLYMPMVPEAIIAMLACARIGAIHSVVFAGFSPEALAGRIIDGQSKIVLTADEGRRGGKVTPLKANVDAALEIAGTECVQTVVMLCSTGGKVSQHPRDVDWQEVTEQQATTCKPETMNAEDPLFILYTSGSTGKPKGVLHTTGGYLTYAAYTFKHVFNHRENQVYWCAADVGWVTGHSYIVYGPLANGTTTVAFEGVPTYPSINRMAQVIDKHKVNVLYTAPTAIRTLMREGDAAVKGTTRESLMLLGSVGEPINPEAWSWYYHTFGEARCRIVDTWWQTETGGIVIAPLPGATDLKPGSATRPMPGIQPALVDNDGNMLKGEAEGNLVLLDSWPGQMRTIFGDHERFKQTYFSQFPGKYCSGDGAKRDADGYYWITGRVDDVINVSGHRMGTAEIESALVAHVAVAEAAVVGCPHDIKGQGIYCYITLTAGTDANDQLATEIKQWVRKEIGPIATPDVIQWAPGLPKTRSGKIMRRILRKIAADDFAELGDTSTLAEPQVVDDLIANRVT